jgi:hypothetical protein
MPYLCFQELTNLKNKIMETSFLKNTAFAAVLLAGLAFTSCKSKDGDATDTEVDTTTATTTDTEMESTDSLDETGARDTISETTDTITTVKP